MIVVFDFDKTLTKKDTLFGFFRVCSKVSVLYRLKLVAYCILMVAHKLRIISNNYLKSVGVKLFLRGQNVKMVKKWAKDYSDDIELNELALREFKKYDSPYIISASFTEYISLLFPMSTIIGSELLYDRFNRVKGLKSNCYKLGKRKKLKDCGINNIDVLYTDSICDLSLAEMAKRIYVVRRDKIIACNDLGHYKRILS